MKKLMHPCLRDICWLWTLGSLRPLWPRPAPSSLWSQDGLKRTTSSDNRAFVCILFISSLRFSVLQILKPVLLGLWLNYARLGILCYGHIDISIDVITLFHFNAQLSNKRQGGVREWARKVRRAEMRSDSSRSPVLTYMGWTCTVLYCSVQCPPLHPAHSHTWSPSACHQNRWGNISDEHHHQGPSAIRSHLYGDMYMFKWRCCIWSVLSVLLWLRLGYKNKKSESESVNVGGWAFLSQADTDSAGVKIVITGINTIRT